MKVKIREILNKTSLHVNLRNFYSAFTSTKNAVTCFPARASTKPLMFFL